MEVFYHERTRSRRIHRLGRPGGVRNAVVAAVSGDSRNRYDRTTYVPALRDPDPPRPVIVDADPLPMLPTAARVQTEIHTSHVDRAKGFQVATVPVAVAAGAGALIVAVAGWSVPALSLVGLLIFWAAFLAWWVLGWLIHNIVSPDGIALVHTLLGWSYLKREQRERHRRYRQ